jgi:PilZ domain
MQQISTALPPRSTRRWPRYQIDLPVRIVAVNGILTTPVMGRGSDISRAGMALNAKLALSPGDLMQLQFPTTEPSRVNAIVRHRDGNRLGLEFLSQLPPDDETKQLTSLPAAVSPRSAAPPKLSTISCTPKHLYEGLRRKQEELRELQKEIEVLKLAVLLLAEDEQETRILPPAPRLQLEHRPWPLPS